jgi:myo-inositol-1(or 4)-monophosphatase
VIHPFLHAAIEANRAIAHALSDGLKPEHRIEGSRGAGGDISVGIDTIAEALFVEHLGAFGRIESEESGSIGAGEHTIVLDPIDGSSNALSGFPYYGTSAALIDEQGTTIAAAVCNLASGEMFVVEVGGSPLRGRLDGDTYRPLVREGVPQVGIFERAYAYASVVKALEETGMKFRAPGAVALSLIYARLAHYFLYVGAYRSYDFAAGLAFCEGMEVEAKEDYVIVTHDKATLEVLRLIVQRTKE